jgi:hypothetical protein
MVVLCLFPFLPSNITRKTRKRSRNSNFIKIRYIDKQGYIICRKTAKYIEGQIERREDAQ